MHVDYYRTESAPQPPEEILNWSIQIPSDRQVTLGELQEAIHLFKINRVPPEARIQLNGNLLRAWIRRTVV